MLRCGILYRYVTQITNKGKEFFMKKFALAALLLPAVILCSAELPAKWDAWFCNMDEKAYNKAIVIPQGKADKLELSEKVLNLDKAAAGRDTVILRNFIESEKDQTLWLGMGCKIFALQLNGKVIYDFRTYGLGNDIENVSVKDHIIPLELKKGSNEIVLSLRRTHWRQDFCYGKDRRILWDIAIKLLKDYQPVKAELAHPEMVYRASNDSMTFMFVTTSPVPAAVEYRPAGSDKWLREYDAAGGLILREKSRVHRIRIEGIANWGDVEYRIVLLEPPAGRDGFKHPLWTARQYKELFMPVKTLRKPDGKKFSLLLFGDTQLSLSESCKTVAQRNEYIKKMRSLEEYKNADIMVHIGDMDSYTHTIEKPLLTNLFDKFAPAPGEKLKPWLLVRGNHETNGIAAEDWFDYFQMPEDKSYYTARIGDVLFIVLDCSDISKVDRFNAYNGPLLNTQAFMEKQTRWLAEVRKSEEFRKARFRVVLAHSEPHLQKSQVTDNIRKVTGDMLEDQSPEGLIHLWLAGHVHLYWRAARGSDKVLAANPYKRVPALAKSPVNYLTVDGPKSSSGNPDFSYAAVTFTPDHIRVKAIDAGGKTLDEFTIDRNGRLQEIYHDKGLQFFSLPEKK